MREFGMWLNDAGKKEEKERTPVELNSRREIMTEMMYDMNRMLTDHNVIHPDRVSPAEDIKKLSPKKDNVNLLYNNNMYEEEWALYKGVAIDED